MTEINWLSDEIVEQELTYADVGTNFTIGGEEFQIETDQIWREDWRWGSEWEKIFLRHSDTTYWRLVWRNESGDGEWNTFEDSDSLTLTQVVPVEIKKVEWKAV